MHINCGVHRCALLVKHVAIYFNVEVLLFISLPLWAGDYYPPSIKMDKMHAGLVHAMLAMALPQVVYADSLIH